MDAINQIARQHRSSVAFVFKKYGINFPVTPKNLRIALLKNKNTDFLQDLQNATIKRGILKHDNFEDDHDYYVVDSGSQDDFDGDETVAVYYEDVDDFDNFGKKKKTKVKKQKKVKKRPKKERTKREKKDRSGRGADSISNAELVDDDSGSTSRTPGEKAELATGIIGNLLNAGGGIASSIMGAKDNGGNEEEAGTFGTSAPTEQGGTKKYLPYIIGGVLLLAVFGGLFYYLKKKK